MSDEKNESSQKGVRREDGPLARMLKGSIEERESARAALSYDEMLSRLAHSDGKVWWERTFPKDLHVRVQAANLEEEIRSLKKSLVEQAKAFEDARETPRDEARVREMEKQIEALQEKQRLEFLLSRVNGEAQRKLLNSPDFQAQFLGKRECNSFVLSVDIRRSTELMLKARTPEQFAQFISKLCTEFSEIITEHYGVFDKFTGDGVLAFFPEFYAGTDAGIYVLNAALACHAAFSRHYRSSRQSFSTVLRDVGLGVGIDYGKTHLLQMAGGLTVVGAPVVYACRLSGAPAGATYLNQPAYELIEAMVGSGYSFSEVGMEIKHEGEILAYNAASSGVPVQPRTPDWVDVEHGGVDANV